MPDSNISPNALTVLKKRYFARNEKGEVVEDEKGFFKRISIAVAEGSPDQKNKKRIAEKYENLLSSLKFLPNTPTLINAGRRLGQLSACFVLPVEDSLSGIFDTIKAAALVHQTGGGTGFSFSRIRSSGSLVKTTGGHASGPISFMKVLNASTDAIKQGGCLHPDTLVFTENGLLRLSELVDQNGSEWQDVSFNVCTDNGIETAYEGHVHGLSETLEVVFSNGSRLIGTPEHRIFVLTNGKLEWKKLKDLVKGDVASLRMGSDLIPSDLVKLSELSRKQRTSVQESNTKQLKLPEVLDEELAYFLGYFYGNGFYPELTDKTKNKRIGWTVPDKKPEMKEKLRTLAESLFGVHVSTNKKENDASENFFVASVELYEWLAINGFAKEKSNCISLPKAIRMSPEKVVAAFIRGYFEADGCVAESHPKASSSSRRFLEDLQVLLQELGIYSVLHEESEQYSKYGNSKMWSLTVRTASALRKWRSIVAWRGELILGRANGDVKNEQHGLFPIPPNVFIKTLDTVKEQYGYGVYRALYRSVSHFIEPFSEGYRNQTQGALSRVFENFGKILVGTDLEKIYTELKHLWFVEVTAVSPAGIQMTLDLSVQNRHAYVANGFVTHNTRRGANMGILRVDHPDILEFIDCKQDLSQLTNFNISVAITDKFMEALKNNQDYELEDPGTKSVVRTISAKLVWDKIVKNARATGEPGLFFIDRANENNPIPSKGQIEATNPCGEQPLGDYQSCTLGSIDLVRHVKNGELDWEDLEKTAATATEFLDDVVSVNKFPIPELAEVNRGTRRIGLGVMGFARMLILLGIPYDSEEGLAMAEKIMSRIREVAEGVSLDRAYKYGVYPYYEGIGPARRNSHLLTIAPTGTISMIADTSSGCEPEFSLIWFKNVMDGAHLPYTLSLFEETAKREGFWSDDLPEKIVANHGSCRGISEVPEKWQKIFATAHDIAPEWHVRMQAAFQKHIDAAVSKTINLPREATVEDVSKAYLLAYDFGCKGITVYRDGSRENQVLNIGESKKEAVNATPDKKVTLAWGERVKGNGESLHGSRMVVKSRSGKSYVHLYQDSEGRPIEIFVTPATAHEEKESAILLGRLGSLALQYGAPLNKVMAQFVKAHEEAGTMGSDVHMIVKAIGKLNEEISTKNGTLLEEVHVGKCPECRSPLAFQEGCLKCTACGFSKC
jgi:ribonucleoside-diphosphate reductase alpha chain